MTIKAVLFDMDGTILDSEPAHTKVLQEVIQKEVGIDISEEDIREYIGLSYDKKLEIIFKRMGIKKDIYNLADMARKKSLENSHLVAKMYGAEELIKRMKENFAIALVTGSGRDQADFFMESVGLKKYFKTIVTSDDVKRNKPSPDIYLLAAEKLKMKPEECVSIEDSTTGIESAKSARMICIAVRNQYQNNPDLSKADLIVESLSDISLEMIRDLG
ncbi:MAG: phosphatase [Candidatus Aenigmarchaeota archaeon CG_4_8_14_3_um_filter_37_24]|nr:MAG: hypothetical protein AUJ50_00275 [Candidatus Aenigmarchaeota archaeon CG1_02_38_14]PIX50971.1 MAG: phosphatase [Candidatus Aenigmarchaeota archaeon CG_4_8_14_3_um_filter_37_24]